MSELQRYDLDDLGGMVEWGDDGDYYLCSDADPVITALQAENERLEARIIEADDRMVDMLKADDGQAYKEARKYLDRHCTALEGEDDE